MKMIILKRQKNNELKIDELCMMHNDLKDFLEEDANPNDKNWNENLNAILDFQDTDGSFKLIDTFKVPSEARVDFCYMPTYICSAILMKAYLTDSSAFTSKMKYALLDGLKMSCARNLNGHGFEAFKGKIDALNIFMKAGVREFLDLYPDFCPKFSKMIEKIITEFDDMESRSDFTGSWGESYEKDIRHVNEYFSQRKVFVYGTLMTGKSNHHFLKNSTLLCQATVKGYDMYNVGWYPAIVSGDGLIIGELYHVPIEDMPSIDMLEGEGSLYIKRCERVTDINGKTGFAFVYVYLEDVTDLEKIPAWENDYVWYVSYGSNMLYQRFMCYIEGGSYEGSRNHPPCDDTRPPVAVKAIEIDYEMYFANESGSWNGSGVSFLDTSKKGKALGVAYLITKEQFDHVILRENAGRERIPGYIWYEDIIDLGRDCFEVKTITNSGLRPYNEPSNEYLDTLRDGIRQNWPEMSDEDIEDYLNACIR